MFHQQTPFSTVKLTHPSLAFLNFIFKTFCLCNLVSSCNCKRLSKKLYSTKFNLFCGLYHKTYYGRNLWISIMS
jgi:hypothetical protein